MSILQFTNITKQFKDSDKKLNASGEVKAGQILALKGPSGSGKSTLLRILARLIKPDTGRVLYKGKHWDEINPIEWRKTIHYVSQKPILFSGSVLENLKMPFNFASHNNSEFNIELTQEYLQKLNLSTETLTQEAKTLSGGEGARISLIRALLINPDVLMLDEPTAYLDLESRNKVSNLLISWLKENSNKAIILISHNETDFQAYNYINYLNISGS